ncbi:MAG: hypothetical protein ACFUZC_13970 [Chthoniobacteraceae bacterium]
MKRTLCNWAVALAIGVAWIGSSGLLNSQEVTAAPVTAEERLAALKAANAALIERQEKTLKKLDDLKEQARIIRLAISRA